MSKIILPSEIFSSNDTLSIVRAINSSKEQYEYWKDERDLGFENGRFLDRWNFIFSNIVNFFTDAPYLTIPISRGALWEFVSIYNTNTKILYLVLREKTFKQIRNRKDNPNHYVRIFNSKNDRLQSEIKQQLSFFSGFEEVYYEHIESNLEKMIGGIKDEMLGCVNILFDEDRNGVKHISANLADNKLDIFKTYNLTQHITAAIEDIIDTKNDLEIPMPKIELGIKEDKIKKKPEEIIEDKKKKDEKQQDGN